MQPEHHTHHNQMEMEKYINEKIELDALLKTLCYTRPFSKHSFDKQPTDGFIGYTQVS